MAMLTDAMKLLRAIQPRPTIRKHRPAKGQRFRLRIAREAQIERRLGLRPRAPIARGVARRALRRQCACAVSEELLDLGLQPTFAAFVATRERGRPHGLRSFLPQRHWRLRRRGPSAPGGLRVASGRALVRGDKIIDGAGLDLGELHALRLVPSFPLEHRRNEARDLGVARPTRHACLESRQHRRGLAGLSIQEEQPAGLRRLGRIPAQATASLMFHGTLLSARGEPRLATIDGVIEVHYGFMFCRYADGDASRTEGHV